MSLIRPVDLALLAKRGTQGPSRQAPIGATTIATAAPVMTPSGPKPLTGPGSWKERALPAFKPAPAHVRKTLRKALEEAPIARKRAESVLRAVKEKGFRLDYDPVNVEVYVNAYNGAMAGMVGGRVLANTVAASYLDQATSAGVWAQQFDVIWADATAIDEVQAELILLESFAVWNQRFSGDLTTGQTTATITAIIASIVEAELYFSGQGITPPAWNSGGGGSSPVPGPLITGLVNAIPTGNTVTPINATAAVAFQFGAGARDGETKSFEILEGAAIATGTTTAQMVINGALVSPGTFTIQGVNAAQFFTWYADYPGGGAWA